MTNDNRSRAGFFGRIQADEMKIVESHPARYRFG